MRRNVVGVEMRIKPRAREKFELKATATNPTKKKLKTAIYASADSMSANMEKPKELVQ